MKRLLQIFQKAQHNRAYLFLLNRLLQWKIPFNKPHGIKLTNIYADGISVLLPYRRKNHNHLKGIHACALATLGEYASGIMLMRSVGAGYRLIMKKINVVYHYQARMDVTALLKLDTGVVSEKIVAPLRLQDSVLFENTIEVFDVEKNHICTALVQWQVKKWNVVKTT